MDGSVALSGSGRSPAACLQIGKHRPRVTFTRKYPVRETRLYREAKGAREGRLR